MTEIRENLNNLDTKSLESNDLLYSILFDLIGELEKIQGKLKIIENKLN